MTNEEKKAIEYFKEKIKNKLPLYEETYIDGKPYRRNIIQLETNFTEEQAHKTKVLLNLIESQQKEIEELKDSNNKLYSILKENKKQSKYSLENNDKKWEDKIKAKIKKYDEWLKNSEEYKESLEAQRYALNELLEELNNDR